MYRKTYKPIAIQRHAQDIQERKGEEKYGKYVDLRRISDCGEQILEEALNDGCDANAIDRHGNRPIHYAAELGRTGYLMKLIDLGADVDASGKDGLTALMLAAKGGHHEAVKLLINSRARVNLKSSKGELALHFAAVHVECLEILLQHNVNVNMRDGLARTTLMLASMADHVPAIKLLLRKEADVNITDNEGKTALHWAGIKNCVKAAQLLIEFGADLDAVDKDGQTAYYYCISYNSPGVLCVLIEAGCDRTAIDGLMGTALALASMKGNAEVAEILIKNGDDPDECGYFGMTPLMLAGYQAHVETVETLLRLGADPNAVGRMGGIAIRAAVMNTNPNNADRRHKILALLIRADTDINARHIQKRGLFCSNTTCGTKSPLMFAVHTGYVSMVQMLLIAGCEIILTDIGDMMKKANVQKFYSCSQLMEPIQEWIHTPRSLMHLCRSNIRQSIAGSVKDLIHKLPIASRLQRYLNFSEFDNIEVVRADMTDEGRAMEGFKTNMCQIKALEENASNF